MTDRMPFFTYILLHVRILYVIEGIWRGKEASRDDVVSKMVKYLNGR